MEGITTGRAARAGELGASLPSGCGRRTVGAAGGLWVRVSYGVGI